MSPPASRWGPEPQRKPRAADQPWARTIILVVLLVGLVTVSPTHQSLGLVTVIFVVIAAVRLKPRLRRPPRSSAAQLTAAPDPVGALYAEVARLGGGAYLGVGPGGGWRLAGRERAVLVLGPPRSGKSSAIMVPAVLAHQGPVVSASTKPDVLAATEDVRSRVGGVWLFDPTGQSGSGGGAEGLRWSPVPESRSWDGALLISRAMVQGSGVGAGVNDSTHWAKRASALLAALLHAAALDGAGMDAVLDWVLGHELDQPGAVLERSGARLGCRLLVGLANTEGRERSSIFSAAADAVDAYSSQAALEAASRPNFDASRFVGSCDTIYVRAPAEHQALAAPLVCGLLAEIRRATYLHHQHGLLGRRVLWALDEVANIAPLAELPQIASEGGGQGLSLLCALQDLSQARSRWGQAAEGFLTLFGEKMILPGVADSATLESVSLALGEYDRPMVSTTRTPVKGQFFSQVGRTSSIQRQRVLSPGEVANVPAGRALHLVGVQWELLSLTPAYRDQPWRALTGGR